MAKIAKEKMAITIQDLTQRKCVKKIGRLKMKN